MNIWVTSDKHHWHGNIIKFCNRPFLAEIDKQALASNGGYWHSGDWNGNEASKHKISDEAISLMNDTLVDTTNKYVKHNDLLFDLGDFSLDTLPNYYENCKTIRNRINCRDMRLIWGNHDSHDIENLFSYTYKLYEFKYNHKFYVLCHYAMLTYNKSHRGAYHFFGHSHGELETWMDKYIPNRLSMDVGVDQAYKITGEFRPFNLDEIPDLITNRNQQNSTDFESQIIQLNKKISQLKDLLKEANRQIEYQNDIMGGIH